MEKVLVVNDGSINAGLLSLIKSKFEVEERNPSQALETLRMMSRGGVGGFDLVISYSHKRQRETTELNTFIEREFPQQLPIVYVTATTVLSGMSGLGVTREQVNSHLQKYRNFKRNRVVSSETSNKRNPKPRKNKLARHFEEYETIELCRFYDKNSMDQAIPAQEISNGFPMDISYNRSVHPEAWPEYSPFRSQQPYVQVMPSIAPVPPQQINNNSQFHDIVGTSNSRFHDIVGTSQPSLNQDYLFPPSQAWPIS
nr:uncharacterized protein LOC109153289 isoform X3 [Ipomoea trifida]